MNNNISQWIIQTPHDAKTWQSGRLICCDALDFLKSLHSSIADIVFLDPPFNLGKIYGESKSDEDRRDERNYFRFLTDVIKSSIRILKPGGALYLYHLPYWALKFGQILDKELSFRHWIAISMKSGFVRGSFLYPAHYALLYFTKGEPNYFKRPKIPTPTCRHCGNYIKDYGGYTQYIENGLNLSDVWEDLSPVRHQKKKNRQSNELPLELTRRIVQISGFDHGLLVDPFVGSGTSLISAVEINMNFLACDRDISSCEVADNRISAFVNNL